MLVGELVDRIENEWLIGTYAASYNQLATAVGPDDLELTLSFTPNGPAAGGLLALYDELCQVVNVVPQSNKVQVIRGVRGTSRAPHGVGTLVEANPRYWRALVRDSAYRELRSWPKELYRTEAFRAPLAERALSIQVQLASQLQVRRVLAVRRTASCAIDSRDFRVTYADALDVNIDGDAWVYLDCPTPRAGNVVVHCATDWKLGSTTWDDLTDLADVGLTDSQADALIIGSTWRLVTGREVRRLQTEAQGQSRTPQEVPVGATSQLGLRLFSLRNERIADEIAQLAWREGHL